MAAVDHVHQSFTSVLRSPLLPIFLVVAVDVLGMTLMIPLLPYYAQHFGASPMTVGILFASFAIFQFISGPILGRISDTAGRKPTLIVSQIGTFVGFMILATANSLWMLFLGRIIDGITAGNLSIAQAYISDVTKPENRTKAFGLIGIAFGIGFMFGPALSGFLSQFGYQWPAYAAAGLSLTSILCSWLLLPSVERKEPAANRMGRMEGFTQFFKRPVARRSLIEFFMFVLSFSVLIGGLALFLERQLSYDAQHTGYVYALSGIVGGLIQGGLLGRMAKSMGEKKLSIIGFLAMAVSFSALGLVAGLWSLITVVVVSSFGSSVTRPSLTALITHSVGPMEQGAILGVSQSLASIAQILGPLLAGFLIEHDQLLAWGLTAGGFALVGAVMLLARGDDGSDAVTETTGMVA